MSEEIFVFDNSPYADEGLRYAQIGIGDNYHNKGELLDQLYGKDGNLKQNANIINDSSVFTPNKTENPLEYHGSFESFFKIPERTPEQKAEQNRKEAEQKRKEYEILHPNSK